MSYPAEVLNELAPAARTMLNIPKDHYTGLIVGFGYSEIKYVLLLVDEIQNAVEAVQRNRQIKPLLKFLMGLTNDTATAVYFVGTPVAEQLFTSQEHLMRRTRSIRLLPLKPDGTYRKFWGQLWTYQ